MQSKRKRAARRQEDTAHDLLQAFRACHAVPRDGNFPVLRWLVRARCIAGSKGAPGSRGGSVPDLLNCANVDGQVPTQRALETLEAQVVAVVQDSKEVPLVHLQYAAYFFKWWAKVVAATSMPRLHVQDTGRVSVDWLEPDSLQRSLVVPDVRRSAIKMLQLLSVRPGEFQIAAEVSGIKSRSCSSVLQALRTGEWNINVQQTLMYGTLTDIYNAGMLDAVYFSIIDSRYVGRLMFEWFDRVVEAPGTPHAQTAAPWPRILAHRRHYVLCWQGKQEIYSSAIAVYRAWAQTCLDFGGVIGGRFDVRKCTI